MLIWMGNGAHIIESLFACWIAGLCAVPVNPKLHGKEVDYIRSNSGARVALVSKQFLESCVRYLPLEPVLSIVFGGSAEYEMMAEGRQADCHRTEAESPAWIFYTSGTTGFPKGATLTNRNLLFMAMSYYSDIEHVHPGDTMLHAAPLSHGSGQYMIPHLLAGGRQLVHDSFDAELVLKAFDEYPRVSMFAVPTMVTRLVTQSRQQRALSKNLRTLIYGGAPMYVADLMDAIEVFGPKFYQLYAQGESPMTISGLNQDEHIGSGDAAHLARLGTCGVARTGVEIRIVSPTGEDLPAGEVGEIVVRSDCVMSGYWNNNEATIAALRDGWLWTGDMGELDAKGYLTLRDRSKDMLISGGSNIYPREIEEVLLTHPGVLECSVIGRSHADLGEEPIAFVVVAAGVSVNAHDLDALCLRNIARFKRPRAYRFLSELPKSSYGKILKSELRKSLKEAGEQTT
nr:long-chain-fatty-acid--CoA ligase [uncultured bacterium]